MKQTLLALAVALGVSAGIARAATNDTTSPFLQETPAQHDARMAWFREARFGMFIHWGLYSQAAGYWHGQPTTSAGEWMMNDKQIPVSQYAQLVPQFDPEKFDAEAWVKVAQDAGMKYIVITTKHHEGFCLWPSKLTDYSIASTPFKRDPLQELAIACHKAGLKLCFYYSIMDWHSPLYAPRKSWNDVATNPPDFDAYDAYMKGQLKELLTNYGPIGLIWFDGCWEDTWNRQRGADLYNYLRGLQPNILVNNRVGFTCAWEDWFRDPAGVGGDYGTPEQSIPADGFGAHLDWEACMTMNDTWGYKRNDDHWKSSATLIHNLIDCASKGGNYLLNIGPTGEGVIPAASVERLADVGRWMKVNGATIYGTAAGPFLKPLPWGRCTAKVSGDSTTLYLHVFDWPTDGELLVPGFMTHVKSAALYADGKKLRAKNSAQGLVITVPPAAPDPISTTIVLKFKGPAKIVPTPIWQKHDGSVPLLASEARLHGSAFQLEPRQPVANIGYWTNPGDWLDWEFQVQHPGKFVVSATIAAPALTSFQVTVAGQNFNFAGPITADYFDYKTADLGVVEIPAAGLTTLAFHPLATGWQPMNLKSLTLRPVKESH